MYDDARVEDEAFLESLATSLGAVVDDEAEGRAQEELRVEWRGDSESEALSQASSSPQSAFALKEETWRPMWGRAGGDRGFIGSSPFIASLNLTASL